MAVACAPEAVLENESADPEIVQPDGIVMTLVLRQASIASARTDDDGRPGGFLTLDKIRSDRGLVPVGLSQSPGCAPGPQQDGFHGRHRSQVHDHPKSQGKAEISRFSPVHGAKNTQFQSSVHPSRARLASICGVIGSLACQSPKEKPAHG